MTLKDKYNDATTLTSQDLKTVAMSPKMRELSKLSLPEIEAVISLVGRIIPAGNIPGIILNGLAQLSPRRRPAIDTVRRDVNALFKGVEQNINKAVYAAFFAGPAAVIWGYQNLLRLAGKGLDDAFPEGTWQFYVEYALREDTARHANETHGFDTFLLENGLHLNPVDRITAWVMATVNTLHQYPDLLSNEWRERVYIKMLREVHSADPQRFANLYREWEEQRPYRIEVYGEEDYVAYRRRRFEAFLETILPNLDRELLYEWLRLVHEMEEEKLPDYLRQMSIYSYLDPGAYGETRTPLPLANLQVGVIHGGRYYLIPACADGSTQPAELEAVRSQVAAIFADPATKPPSQLKLLARVRRAALPILLPQFSQTLQGELKALRLAPVLVNADPRPRQISLSEVRAAERGIGDHAMTIFDTGKTFVFDQSHIFFDGAWGSALAEIVTNEAIQWAKRLNELPAVEASERRPFCPPLQFEPQDIERIAQAPQVLPEASAETDLPDLKAIQQLRRLCKARNDLIVLTVNDLLVLYRAIHAVTYKPSHDLVLELHSMRGKSKLKDAVHAAGEALNADERSNPAILIPIDASQNSPRDRLYPMTFKVPLMELDLIALHQHTLKALHDYELSTKNRDELYTEFDELQRRYLATLAGFGAVMTKAKAIASTNESYSAGTLKLLAHLPTPLQRLLDQIPTQFDILNDIIKGREVFSNVGAVADRSSLTRFMTAKDDNEKKMLAWGVITDSAGKMRITLRDFRPHVALLEAVGCKHVAIWMAQDYLDSYAAGLNQFIRDLLELTAASRDTTPTKRRTKTD